METEEMTKTTLELESAIEKIEDGLDELKKIELGTSIKETAKNEDKIPDVHKWEAIEAIDDIITQEGITMKETPTGIAVDISDGAFISHLELCPIIEYANKHNIELNIWDYGLVIIGW